MDTLIKFLKAGFPYKVVITLLAASVYEHSTAMVAGAVFVLGFIMAKDLIEKIKLKEATKVAIPEETRRLMQDLSARVTTLEFGVKQRGF